MGEFESICVPAVGLFKRMESIVLGLETSKRVREAGWLKRRLGSELGRSDRIVGNTESRNCSRPRNTNEGEDYTIVKVHRFVHLPGILWQEGISFGYDCPTLL